MAEADSDFIDNYTNLNFIQGDLNSFSRQLEHNSDLSKNELDKRYRDITDANQLKTRLSQVNFIRDTLNKFASEKENLEFSLRNSNNDPCLLIDEKYHRSLLAVIPTTIGLIDRTEQYKSGLLAIQNVDSNVQVIKNAKKQLSLDIVQLKVESKKLIEKRKELNSLLNG